MEDWSVFDCDSSGRFLYYEDNFEHMRPQCVPAPAPEPFTPSPSLTLLLSPQASKSTHQFENLTKGESPRELRNKAEKLRRDKMNRSVSYLSTIVPPVAVPARKIDKTSVLRLTAHYLRSHQYVFGDSIKSGKEFSVEFMKTLLDVLGGFIITTTYKGIVVVVSPNVEEYLGFTELELLGHNICNFVLESDHALLREQLMPPKCMLGPNGELLLPDDPEGKNKIVEALTNEKRSFFIRFKKLNQQRSGPLQYVTFHVEGTLRKADRACPKYNRYSHIVRRARFRGEQPNSSGNDVVFVGFARPTTEKMIIDNVLESPNMEYRTRHSIDGQILQCEQRIALVTGYMMHEVSGVNAMNFMHRDDVRWVIVALREMYDESRLFGESCYRLMTKNGEFIYMRTRGSLDVDKTTNAVTSFVCTNTLVSEEEGKHLIKMMKKRYMLVVDYDDFKYHEDHRNSRDISENNIPVEDPEYLKEVILHLVTNLPSQESTDTDIISPSNIHKKFSRLSIIPPKKDRILNAILKSRCVIGNPAHVVDEPVAGPSGLNGTRRSHDDDSNPEPPTKMPKNDDILFEDDISLSIFGLTPADSIPLEDIDNVGIDWDFLLDRSEMYTDDFLNG